MSYPQGRPGTVSGLITSGILRLTLTGWLVTSLAFLVLAGTADLAKAANDLTDDDQSPTTAAPILTIGDSIYLGSEAGTTGVEVFRGVPFAAAPVGENRWRPPVPLPARPGRHDATEFAPACIQGGYISAWYRDVAVGFDGDPDQIMDPPESEDCLYLNIWRPGGESSIGNADLRPVLVYIHGGNNTGGGSWEPNYNGQHLAARGLVVVTITYRLGVFGFFSHPEEPHANFGLLDQVAALRWVQRHAKALGGDRNRITVMGESSGGNNIAHLLALPEARGLFQRAIVQSAGWALQDTRSKDSQDPAGLALQDAVLGEGGSLRALRQAPAESVFDAAPSAYLDHPSRPVYDPVIDQVSVSRSVIEVVNDGELAPVDLIVGSNRDEWLMYLPDALTLDTLDEQGLPALARELTTQLLSAGASMERALDRVVTAWNMVCPSLHLAAAVARQGGRSWVYWFTRQREGPAAASMGAYHGAELPYIFDTHDAWLPTSAGDRALSRAIGTYWTAFATTGNPNVAGLPAWPGYQQAGDPIFQLDMNPASLPHPEAGLCVTLGVAGQAE